MKLLRRQSARDLAIVAAVVALGAFALADALRDRRAEEAGDGRAATAATTDEREASATRAEEPQDTQTPTTTTVDGEPSVPRLPGGAASGLLAFTTPGSCELRAFDLRSGRMLGLPRLETSCELFAPRVGSRVAYNIPEEAGSRRGRILDLENPRASFGEYVGAFGIVWGPDGSRFAWCDGPRSGFELTGRSRPKRLHHCPRAYDAGGVTASVNNRQEIVIEGRPLLRARGPVWQLAWGVDGSLAVVMGGGRVDRYEGGHLVGTARVPPVTPDSYFTIWADLAPDNCAALSVTVDVVRLIDLGCFRGQAPRTVQGAYADWSPNGEWIAVAEPDAIVFHRVIGPEASVRWNVAAGQLAWLSG